MKRSFVWLGTFLILTIIFGTIYTTLQQSLRLSANDPQVQLAEDTASSLNAGSTPQSLVVGHIDIARSLAPFIIIYDKQYRVVAGNGFLNNSVPQIPAGVLKSSEQKDNWVTWQPASNVRIASVTISASNYYVVSGRSLRLIENREDQIMTLSVAGYISSLIVLAALYILSKNPKLLKTRQ